MDNLGWGIIALVCLFFGLFAGMQWGAEAMAREFANQYYALAVNESCGRQFLNWSAVVANG